jgi:hypothetical protein
MIAGKGRNGTLFQVLSLSTIQFSGLYSTTTATSEVPAVGFLQIWQDYWNL